MAMHIVKASLIIIPSIQEILFALILVAWVILVSLVITKKIYNLMLEKNIKENVAIYYNRKIIHVLAGGLVAFLVPFIFSSFLIPLIVGLLMAVALYLPHRTGKLFYWFQVPENYYEVNFCLMWGIIIAIGWYVFQNAWYAIVPVLFMSIGDAVTGFTRNLIYKRRTKAWVGNLAMGIVTIPMGSIAGIAGIIAAIFCSFIEHFEFKYIDDNVTIPISSFLILLAFTKLI